MKDVKEFLQWLAMATVFTAMCTLLYYGALHADEIQFKQAYAMKQLEMSAACK